MERSAPASADGESEWSRTAKGKKNQSQQVTDRHELRGRTPFRSDLGSVHLSYNASYLACFSSRNSIFLSKKSDNSIFQPAYNSSRTSR
jgi:hypothetical protein